MISDFRRAGKIVTLMMPKSQEVCRQEKVVLCTVKAVTCQQY